MNPQLLGQKLLPREAAAGTKVQYMPLNGRLFFTSLGPERNFHFNASWPQSLGVLSPSKNLMLIIDLFFFSTTSEKGVQMAEGDMMIPHFAKPFVTAASNQA